MAKQKSTFQVPIQTDILSGGNLAMPNGYGKMLVSSYLLRVALSYPVRLLALHKQLSKQD